VDSLGVKQNRTDIVFVNFKKGLWWNEAHLNGYYHRKRCLPSLFLAPSVFTGHQQVVDKRTFRIVIAKNNY